MSLDEGIVLHELIAASEFANDLTLLELSTPTGQKVLSGIQQALAPLIPSLGTSDYGATVQRAYNSINPSPYE